MTHRFSVLVLAFAFATGPAFAQSVLSDFASPHVTGTPTNAPSVGGGANTLLDQAPDQSNGAFSDIDCQICNTGVQVMADNFVLDLGGIGQDVSFLTWFGGWFPANTPPGTPTFDITFYTDLAGIPDPAGAVCSMDSVVPTPTATGLTVIGVDEYQYDLDVDLGDCNLVEGAIYWLVIFNIATDADDDFFWEVGDLDVVSGIEFRAVGIEFPVVTWILTAGELAVTITGDDKTPVELISFDAVVSATDVSLNWETASETNNAGFEVQMRSGETWDALGWVEGHGTTRSPDLQLHG